MILKPQRIAMVALMLLAILLLTAQAIQAQASTPQQNEPGLSKPAPADIASLFNSLSDYDVPAPLCTTGSLQVTKVVHWNNCAPVPGQTFSICIQGPSYPIPNCKTFSDAGDLVKTWTDLIPGTYRISEPDPGVGWTKSIPVSTVTVIIGETAKANVYNYHKTGIIQVRKLVTGNPPDPNQVFHICLSGPAPATTSTCQDFKAGEMKSWTGLAPGDYTISETNPGSSWEVSIDHPLVRINPDGSTNYTPSGSLAPLCTETTVTNKYVRTGKIDVRKVIDWNGSLPDPDMTFTICLAGPSFPAGPDCKSFKDGEEKTWSGLLPGVYTISENNPGAGWSVTIDHPTIQVNPDGSLTWLSGGPLGVMCTGATVTNTLNAGRLVVTKIVNWAGLDPVDGQAFHICVQGPSFPSVPDCKSFIYPNDLVQTWSNLIPGSYTVTETGTGSEWVVAVPPGPVPVTPGTEAQASVTNTHKRPVILSTTPLPSVDFVGAILNDSAVLSGGLNPTGALSFNLFPPGDADCSGQPVYSQDVLVDQGNGTYITSPGFTSNQAGTWNWTALYSGDANHSPVASGCKAEMVTVEKARPALNTVPNPVSGRVGDLLNDTALLTGGVAPTGRIFFNLYPPSDAACEGNPVYGQLVPVDHGNGSYATTPGFTSNTAGTWRWTAAYSGDQNNVPVSSGCQDEMVTVTRTDGSITTEPRPAAGIVGDVLNDTAVLSGFINPTGRIAFKLFPPSDFACSGAPVFAQAVDVNGNGAYQTNPGYPSDQTGIWNWTADYSGDANNNPAASGCTLEQVTISYRPGSILIKKQVDWNGIPPVAGQTFEICLTGPDALPVSACKTFSAGQTQSWDNLAPGTYIVSEPDPGSAWNTTITPTTVDVTPDGKPSVDLVTVSNTRKLGSLKVTKFVDWNGVIPVSGTAFNICVQGPSFPLVPDCKTFTYPDDLDNTWENLIPGSYTVTEPGTDSSWIVSVKESPVTVPENGGVTPVTVTNTARLAALQVTKTVDWNGITPVIGTTFSICIQGPSFPTQADCKDFTYPNALVQTWTDLIPGDYIVTEPSAGSEWAVSLPAAPAPVNTLQIAQAGVSNTRKLGKLAVTKTIDWNGIVPDPAVSFEICISGPSFPQTPGCKTFNAANGWTQVWENLLPGDYILSETFPGSEWTVTVSPIMVTVPINGATASARVNNQRKVGSITVTKSVNWNGVTPIQSQTFSICLRGASFPQSPNCKTFTYPNDLSQTWTNLIPGDYFVTEQGSGNEWQVQIDNSHVVIPIGGGPVQVQVTNTRKLGSLQVIKTVDWKGIPPDPARVFRICIQGPSYPLSADCKDFGNSTGWTQTWLNLIPGGYLVSEEDPGVEWNVTVPGSMVTVPVDGGAVTTNVTNTYKPGRLIVIKSVDWGNAVPNPLKIYEICVTGPSFPVANCKYISYMGSTLTWENLVPGQYDVTETDPGATWKVTISDTPGIVRAGGYATVHVQNRMEEPTGISLVNFNAARQLQKRIKLTWQSASENNLAGFKLYRSTSSDFNTRQSVGFVQSRGGGTSYEFVDMPPANGFWFYWLVTVDTNANQFVALKANAQVGDYWSFLPVLNK